MNRFIPTVRESALLFLYGCIAGGVIFALILWAVSA